MDFVLDTELNAIAIQIMPSGGFPDYLVDFSQTYKLGDEYLVYAARYWEKIHQNGSDSYSVTMEGEHLLFTLERNENNDLNVVSITAVRDGEDPDWAIVAFWFVEALGDMPLNGTEIAFSAPGEIIFMDRDGIVWLFDPVRGVLDEGLDFGGVYEFHEIYDGYGSTALMALFELFKEHYQ
jgi:hypothetical protein